MNVNHFLAVLSLVGFVLCYTAFNIWLISDHYLMVLITYVFSVIGGLNIVQTVGWCFGYKLPIWVQEV